jgi:hypothetical protein
MFCELDSVDLCCTKEKIIGVKSFRLKQLSEMYGKWSRIMLPGRSLFGLVVSSHQYVVMLTRLAIVCNKRDVVYEGVRSVYTQWPCLLCRITDLRRQEVRYVQIPDQTVG